MIITAYLALVIAGFSTFMIVLAAVYAYVKAGDREAAKASAGKIAAVVPTPRPPQAADAGGEVRDVVGVN